VFLFAGPSFLPEGVEGPNNTDIDVGITKALVESHPNPEYASWDGINVMNGMLHGFDGS
jgi:hypothetical protein